jgi:hypothetical protein
MRQVPGRMDRALVSLYLALPLPFCLKLGTWNRSPAASALVSFSDAP